MEKKAGYFPLFVDLRGKKVLIVGAGNIASRRATVLVEFGANVTVVAPKEGKPVTPDTRHAERTGQNLRSDQSVEDKTSLWECQTASIRSLAQAGRLIWKQRVFEERDLEDAFLVLAAASDPAVNDEVVRLCHKRGIPVNHAGDQSQCDFQFPAIVRKDPVVLGINAGGTDHGLVKRVAAKLRQWIAGEGEDFFAGRT